MNNGVRRMEGDSKPEHAFSQTYKITMLQLSESDSTIVGLFQFIQTQILEEFQEHVDERVSVRGIGSRIQLQASSACSIEIDDSQSSIHGSIPLLLPFFFSFAFPSLSLSVHQPQHSGKYTFQASGSQDTGERI